MWDDSRALAGEVGEYIVMARRTGEQWFVGTMTNQEARTVSFPTDFLKPGRNLYEDDDRLDTRTKVRTTVKVVKPGKPMVLNLKASGGAALHFRLVK